jgi:hypothetical protein
MQTRTPPLDLRDVSLYLNTKLSLFSSYVVNCTCYCYFKSLGKPCMGHPITKQLLELRYAIVKTQELDKRFAVPLSLLYEIVQLDEKTQTQRYGECLVQLMAGVHGSDVILGSDDDTDDATTDSNQSEDDSEDARSREGEGLITKISDNTRKLPTMVDIEEDEEKFGRAVSEATKLFLV